MEPICYIVGACQPGELYLPSRRAAFVIAADKGLCIWRRRGSLRIWSWGILTPWVPFPRGLM